MNKPFVVAELSANHNQNLEIAKKSLIAIKKCGADAIKIQTYTPDCLTLDCNNEYFQINSGTLWDGRTLYQLYEEAYMPWEWHNELFNVAKSLNITIFSSPFSLKALELLEKLECPMYKIASFEITDTNLIYEVAKTQKPIIISTGIATEEEIYDALDMCKKAKNSNITLLKCTSSYPAPLQEANLLSMPELGKKYGVKYGLSDHTKGHLSAIIATTLGASMIEKHFILDKTLGGVDADFSLDEKEFEQMVCAIDSTILALGNTEPTINLEKLGKQRKFARSLFVCKDIKKGEMLTEENIRSIRPNDGLAPKHLKDLIGKKASKDLEFGKPLQMEDFS